MKKYNNSTGCYKIDIFIDGVYFCSTDQSKTCKQAKEKFLKKYPEMTGVSCHFAKI